MDLGIYYSRFLKKKREKKKEKEKKNFFFLEFNVSWIILYAVQSGVQLQFLCCESTLEKST